MDTCLNRLACFLMLESLCAPPEADEFVAEFCRGGVPPGACWTSPCPEAVVDGT